MTVTVYSDGSYDKKTNRGSFAYALICDLFRNSHAGPIPTYLGYSTHHYTEMYALTRGILHATKVPGCKVIVAVTDSKTCVRFFYNRPPECRDNLIGLANKVMNECRELGIKLVVKHIKGHQKSSKGTHRLNNFIDRLAKSKNQKRK